VPTDRKHVVYQTRSWRDRPVGAAHIAPLDKETPKMLFFYTGADYRRTIRKKEVFYRVFDTKTEAEAWLAEQTAKTDLNRLYQITKKLHGKLENARRAMWAEEKALGRLLWGRPSEEKA